MEQKAFRVSLRLKEGKSPHLYLVQIKEIMKDDVSLHPMMEKTLKLLKKTKTPFIMLSKLRELVVDPLNFRHFERSADPKGSWVCTLWSEEEMIQFKANPDEHIKAMFHLFESLGYEFYDTQLISQDYLEMLENITANQIHAQLTQRSMEEEEEQ